MQWARPVFRRTLPPGNVFGLLVFRRQFVDCRCLPPSLKFLVCRDLWQVVWAWDSSALARRYSSRLECKVQGQIGVHFGSMFCMYWSMVVPGHSPAVSPAALNPASKTARALT